MLQPNYSFAISAISVSLVIFDTWSKTDNIIFTNPAVHSSKPSTFISLIKNYANLYSRLSKILRFLSEPRWFKCSQWNMGHFGLWIRHCSRMQSFMKVVLTISRKRCLAQMKISSRNIPRNIIIQLFHLCGRPWRLFHLVLFPSCFTCLRTID